MKNTIIIFIYCLLSSYFAIGQTYTTIYTPLGKAVQCEVHEELSQATLQQATNAYLDTFPNAIIIDVASNLYNSNGYALMVKNGRNSCWINKLDSDGNSNVEKFFTNDYYKEVTSSSSQSSAPLVYYYSDGHSAVKSTTYTGKYESKWNNGPVMCHDIDYVPFPNPSNRKYYTKKSYSYAIQGSAETYVGNTQTYTAPIPGGSSTTIRYVWEIVDGKGENNGFTQSASGRTNTITFTKSGIFELYCIYYSTITNELLGEAWLEVLVDL